MEHLNDIELVELSLKGDARAFEHLVNRHYSTVFRIAFRWCGIRPDAEDIAQNVFVKLARKLKTFGQRSAFKTWLYRITINSAKDFIRKAATKRGYEAAYAIEQGRNNSGPLCPLTAWMPGACIASWTVCRKSRRPRCYWSSVKNSAIRRPVGCLEIITPSFKNS